MKRNLAFAVILALGAGGAHAKAAYCQDPTTHKRISCKTTPAAPASASTPMAPVAATKPTEPAYKPAPAKPSMMSMFHKPAAQTAPTVPSMASGGAMTGGAPHCTKGKVCGHSCIAMTKVCHKP